MEQKEKYEKKVEEKEKMLGGTKKVEESEYEREGDVGEDVKVKKKVVKETD